MSFPKELARISPIVLVLNYSKDRDIRNIPV